MLGHDLICAAVERKSAQKVLWFQLSIFEQSVSIKIERLMDIVRSKKNRKSMDAFLSLARVVLCSHVRKSPTIISFIDSMRWAFSHIRIPTPIRSIAARAWNSRRTGVYTLHTHTHTHRAKCVWKSETNPFTKIVFNVRHVVWISEWRVWKREKAQTDQK